MQLIPMLLALLALVLRLYCPTAAQSLRELLLPYEAVEAAAQLLPTQGAMSSCIAAFGQEDDVPK